MGFPEWTLWGMGLSVAGALVAISLSWLGQSPKQARSLGLAGIRLDRRVRAFTGYALALLLLAIAFFLAGVPLGASSEADSVAQQESAAAGDPNGAGQQADAESVSVTEQQAATPATPETGAFSGPPASGPSPEAGDSATSLATPRVTSPPPAIDSSEQLTATRTSASPQATAEAAQQPTETPTPVPSETPLPSLTPTALVGETASVNTNGSTLWLKRSPGGQNLVLVRDGDLVILRTGRANQAGILWREVATVNGVGGWLQAEFLAFADQGSGN